MGIHNVGSRVSIKDETLNLNSVPSSARNKVFRRVRHTRGLVRDVCSEMPIWSFILFPFCLIYLLFRLMRRVTSVSTVKFSMVDADMLQLRLRGDFRSHHAEELEVFTDGRQNDVDLANISLTWHMKVLSDFHFVISEYYNGDDDMDDGDMSMARQITIRFEENFKEFELTYRTCDDQLLCARRPLILQYRMDPQLTKQSSDNLRMTQVMPMLSEEWETEDNC